MALLDSVLDLAGLILPKTDASTAQNRMIVLSPDALADVERLQTFLDRVNPRAARRAMTATLNANERLNVRLYRARHSHRVDRGYFDHAHLAWARGADLTRARHFTSCALNPIAPSRYQTCGWSI